MPREDASCQCPWVGAMPIGMDISGGRRHLLDTHGATLGILLYGRAAVDGSQKWKWPFGQ